MSDPSHRVLNFSTGGVSVAQDAEDAASIRRCLDGDCGAFAGIVERYQRVLFTVAVRMLGGGDDANRATQEAFVKVYQSLVTADSTRRFSGSLYRSLLNECRNRRRGADDAVGDAILEDTPADLFEAGERRRRIQASVLRLRSDYREVIALRHFGQLSYDEIADTLQLAPTIVKARVYHARTSLGRSTQLLEELGAEEPPAGFVREVMERIERESRLVSTRTSDAGNARVAITRKAFMTLAAAAAVVLIVFIVRGVPVVDLGTDGTIGALKDQIGDDEAQQFLRSAAFDRLVNDPEARRLLSDSLLKLALADKAFADAFRSADVTGALRSEALTRIFATGEARAAVERAIRAAIQNAAIVSAVREAGFRSALRSGKLEAAMAAR
jgi:RNA polymerase sigma-70 factor (ECF subfamily)